MNCFFAINVIQSMSSKGLHKKSRMNLLMKNVWKLTIYNYMAHQDIPSYNATHDDPKLKSKRMKCDKRKVTGGRRHQALYI